MKLLYAVMDEDRFVVESSGQEVRMLTSETEVNKRENSASESTQR